MAVCGDLCQSMVVFDDLWQTTEVCDCLWGTVVVHGDPWWSVWSMAVYDCPRQFLVICGGPYCTVVVLVDYGGPWQST